MATHQIKFGTTKEIKSTYVKKKYLKKNKNKRRERNEYIQQMKKNRKKLFLRKVKYNNIILIKH